MKSSKGRQALQRIPLAALGAFVLLPPAWVLLLSLQNPSPVREGGFAAFLHNTLSLKAYASVLFHNLSYWAGFWNTLLLSLPAVALATLIATLAAYGLCGLPGRARQAAVLGYILLALLPSQVLLVPNYIALSACGLIGSRLSVILTAGFSPYYVYFIYRFCSQLPPEAFEAARLEGAGEWAVYRKIALPQMLPGILTLALISGADLWNMVEQPLAFLQRPEKYPLAILFRDLEGQARAAGSILFSIPLLLLFFCCGRDLARGSGGS